MAKRGRQVIDGRNVFVVDDNTIIDRGPAEYEPKSDVISINSDSAEDLSTIKGISGEIANAIIAGRPWDSVDDLVKVPGIGAKKLENIAGQLES